MTFISQVCVDKRKKSDVSSQDLKAKLHSIPISKLMLHLNSDICFENLILLRSGMEFGKRIFVFNWDKGRKKKNICTQPFY